MPQPKFFVKSLSVFCMDSIIDNMDKWAASHNLEHVSHYFYILPLHCVIYIRQRIFYRSEETLNLLMSPHLRSLNLSPEYMSAHDKCESGLERNFRILRLASVRCSKLSQLKLGGIKKVEIFDATEFINAGSNQVIKIDDFFSMLGLFEHLQLLDLSYTNYGANCLPILGSTRKPQLRYLFVDHCLGVTNTIIQDLCIGQTSLIELRAHKTEVTHIGAKFAIEHLPELKLLFYNLIDSDFFKIFSEIHDEARELKKYQLAILMIKSNIPYKKGSIPLLVSMCPYVLDIYMFVNEGITDFEFLAFRELRQIRSLVIYNGSPLFTFRGGILPVFKVHGHTLETLVLKASIFSREVDLIIDLCPNVRLLSLRINNDIQLEGDRFHLNPWNESSGKSVPLKKLKEVYLKPAVENSKFVISPKSLLLLLSSPFLTKIFIANCLTLNDEIIEKVCARNSFENLTHLRLWDCPAVSQKGVDFFMNENNPLELISLHNCGDVDFESLKKKAKEKHWDNVTITEN